MNTFNVKVSIDNNLILYSNDIVYFSSHINYGYLKKDDIQKIEIELLGNYNNKEVILQHIKNKILSNNNDYFISNIVKYIWETDDGYFYNEANCKHKIVFSGDHFIKLKVCSQNFYENINNTNVIFRFYYNVLFNFYVESKILKILQEYHPTWELIKNKETEDFYRAIANFFEKLYKETTGIFDLWDAEKINPKFFEYLSLTLGHSEKYTKKIGIDPEKDNFDEYDIIDKINKNKATKEEIEFFRRFLLFSSELFRKKGSSKNIEKFLSFFKIKSKIVDLYTTDWFQKTIGVINEKFYGNNFEDNIHKFVWNRENIIDCCNDNDSILIKKFSSIVLDNYHKVQVLNYLDSTEHPSKPNWVSFNIDHSLHYILDIKKNNGAPLVPLDILHFEPTFYDIDNEKAHFDKKVFEDVDSLLIRYDIPTQEIKNNAFISSFAYKNFDINVQFLLHPVNTNHINKNYNPQNKELFIIFRGQKNTIRKNNYALNSYYKLLLDGQKGFVSLIKVIENNNGSIYKQFLNISNNKKEPLYKKKLNRFSDENNCSDDKDYLFDDVIYELEVLINGSLVSAYLYKNNIQTKNTKNVYWGVGENNYFENTCLDKIVLFENVSLEQENYEILSLDVNEQKEIINIPYKPILDKGYYGFGIRNSVVELFNYNINVLDFNNKLYTKKEKQLYVKPDAFEFNNKLLKFNSQKRLDTTDYYILTYKEPYNYQNFDYYISNKNFVNLYFDDLQINEHLGTRYTITFDKNWMKNTFKNQEELINKIIVPFGSQYQWFAVDIPFINKNLYRNYYNNDSNPIDPETNKPIFIPGLFKYSLNPILDEYYLQPEDSFSTLIRKSDLEFIVSSRLNDYIDFGGIFEFDGVYQEVCPLSNVFEELEEYRLNDDSIYSNPLFTPIYFDGNKRRIIGVRFKNCDDIERLISINETPSIKKIYLYGLFEMILPEEAVKFAPNYEKIPYKTINNKKLYICKFFLPLGLLNKNIRTYSLNINFLKLNENSDSDEVILKGLYVKIPSENNKFKQNEKLLILDKSFKNPYEDPEKELYCKHYISGKIKLASKVKPIFTDSFDNTYVLDTTIRSILLNIEKNLKTVGLCSPPKKYSYEKDYQWWLPNKIFRKRDFIRLEHDYSNGIISNIPQANIQNTKINYNFYGYYLEIENNNWEKVAPLTFKLSDGPVNKNTLYYAKVNINLEYLGFSLKEIKDVNAVNNPIDEKEFKNLHSKNKKLNKSFQDFKNNNLFTCLTLYMPISWATDENTNLLEWGNFIKGAYTTDYKKDPIITFTPIGLMTYFINNANNVNKIDKDIFKEIVLTTRNWTYEEWNEFFDNHIDIEFIAEEIPSKYYKLYEEYCLLPDLFLNEGSEIKITYNVTNENDLNYRVFDTFSLYIKKNNDKKFVLPLQFKYMDYWINNVYSVSLHKVLIPRKYYKFINENYIKFEDYKELSYYTGANLKAVYFYDDKILYKKTIYDKFNFNIKKEINYIPYEGLIDDNVLWFNNRKANQNLVFRSVDNIYNLIKYKNNLLFQPNLLNASNIIDFKKSGSLHFQSYDSENSIRFYDNLESNLIKCYSINKKANIFELESEFIFDENIDDSYRDNGKKFEYILLGTESFDVQRNKFILSSYFFVGIGSFNFDLALGYAEYDQNSGKMKKTFLAGFGEYNTKNIKTNVFYKLKVSVSDNYIRVFLSENEQPYMLVLNYYLKDYFYLQENVNVGGDFEELVYIISGLNDNDIIYPKSLQRKITEKEFKEIFNEKLFKSIKHIGNINGLLFYNNKTYIKEIVYSYFDGNTKTFGDNVDVNDYYYEISSLNKILKSNVYDVKFIGKTLSNTTVLLVNDSLFYKLNNGNVILLENNVKNVFVKDEYVIVQFNNLLNNIKVYNQNFTKFYNLYVKDLYFNVDYLFNYLKFTNRRIKNIWVTKNSLYIEFDKYCLGWNENTWNSPYWGCFIPDFEDTCYSWNQQTWNYHIWNCEYN